MAAQNGTTVALDRMAGAHRLRPEPLAFAGDRAKLSIRRQALLRPDGQTVGWTGSDLLQRTVELAGSERITDALKESSLVALCCRIRACAVRSVPARLLTSDPTEDEQAQPILPRADPLARVLLRRPNDHQTALELLAGHVYHMDLDGESVWFLMDAKGQPIGGPDFAQSPRSEIPPPTTIVCYRGSSVELKVDARGIPSAYKYPGSDPRVAQNAREIWFPAHSVVHFKHYDPDEQRRGFGPIEALARVLALDFQAERYIESGLASGGDFGGYMLLPNALGPGNSQALEKELDEDRRAAKSRGKLKILDNMKDARIERNNAAPKDMEYGGLRSDNEERILAGMGVPPPVAGFFKDTKYSNFEFAIDTFWFGPIGIDAILSSIEDVLNNMLLARVTPSMGQARAGLGGEAGRYHFQFDRSVVPALQARMLARIEKAAALAGGDVGVSFYDAARIMDARVSDEEMPETARVAYAGVGKVLAEHVIEGKTIERGPRGGYRDPGTDAPSEDPPTEEKQSLPEYREDPARAAYRQRRIVWQRLNAQVLYPGEKRIKRVVRDYLREYELAQHRRLHKFADGKLALAMHTDVRRAGDIAERILNAQASDFGADDIAVLLNNSNDWQALLDERITPEIEAAWNLAAGDIAEELRTAALEASDPRASVLIKAQRIKVVEGVESTLAQRIAENWAKVLQEHATTTGTLQEITRQLLPELDERLRRVFGSKDARAAAIARTESGQAANTARHETLIRDGIEKQTWATEGDNVVRPQHQALDGITLAIGSEFAPGLTHPHDPDAPAEQVINCRCVAIPEL